MLVYEQLRQLLYHGILVSVAVLYPRDLLLIADQTLEAPNNLSQQNMLQRSLALEPQALKPLGLVPVLDFVLLEGLPFVFVEGNLHLRHFAELEHFGLVEEKTVDLHSGVFREDGVLFVRGVDELDGLAQLLLGLSLVAQFVLSFDG